MAVTPCGIRRCSNRQGHANRPVSRSIPVFIECGYGLPHGGMFRFIGATNGFARQRQAPGRSVRRTQEEECGRHPSAGDETGEYSQFGRQPSRHCTCCTSG